MCQDDLNQLMNPCKKSATTPENCNGIKVLGKTFKFSTREPTQDFGSVILDITVTSPDQISQDKLYVPLTQIG